MSYWQWIYLLGLLAAEGLRLHHRRPRQKYQLPWSEKAVLLLVILGIWLLPAVFVFTPWLDFASYHRPEWLGWLALLPFVANLWLRWRAQRDLGRNWSSTLAVRPEHRLVTEGIYRFLRHPIYTALWLWALAQPLLLPNWAAGFGGLLAVIPLTLLRIPREEALMLEQFGDAYRTYMNHTGRLLPRRRPSQGKVP
jgi:protein-S-isoprenylcysteine O-methyltransferase Ste14